MFDTHVDIRVVEEHFLLPRARHVRGPAACRDQDRHINFATGHKKLHRALSFLRGRGRLSRSSLMRSHTAPVARSSSDAISRIFFPSEKRRLMRSSKSPRFTLGFLIPRLLMRWLTVHSFRPMAVKISF